MWKGTGIVKGELVSRMGVERNMEMVGERRLVWMKVDKKKELEWENEGKNGGVMEVGELGIEMREREENVMGGGGGGRMGVMGRKKLEGGILIEVGGMKKNLK